MIRKHVLMNVFCTCGSSYGRQTITRGGAELKQGVGGQQRVKYAKDYSEKPGIKADWQSSAEDNKSNLPSTAEGQKAAWKRPKLISARSPAARISSAARRLRRPRPLILPPMGRDIFQLCMLGKGIRGLIPA